MNQIYEERLTKLNSDKTMLEALKWVLYGRVEAEKPEVRDGEGDDLLGAKFRAYEKAKSILDGFFKDINSYNEEKPKQEEINKEL